MLADGMNIPSNPAIYPVYRGFYILPGEALPEGVVRVDFFVERSTDDIQWTNLMLVGSGDNTVGFYAVHSGLDENIFYSYFTQYVFSDGSKTPLSQQVEAGNAQLIANSDLNIDQLASGAYSTGLVTAGTFRGIIFETNAINPKVRMDPSGIFATDINSNIVFDLPSDGSTALFSGLIEASGINLVPITSIGGKDRGTSTSQITWSIPGEAPQGLISLFGSGVGVTHVTKLQMLATPVQNDLAVSVSMVADNAGNAEASLTCTTNNTGSSAAFQTVGASLTDNSNNTVGITIYDANKRSEFMKLAGGAPKLSGVGTATLTWGGASVISNNTVVGLIGATGDVYAIATCNGISSILDAVIMDAHSNTNGTVTFRGTSRGGAPAGGATATFFFTMWEA